MTHTYYKELLYLSACGELEGGGLLELEEHLHSCGECRAELDEMKKMQALTRHARFDLPQTLLDESRSALHRELLNMTAKKEPLIHRVTGFVRDALFANYKTAFGAIAMAALGIVIGYALFSPSGAGEHNALVLDTSAVRYFTEGGGAVQSVTKENPRAENIRILHADEGSGLVEFVFDAVTPVRVSGTLSDKNVQRVLARALVDEENPGVRLRALNVIASQTEHASDIDAEVKTALLKALQADDNPAVRSQAVNALQQFSYDAQIQRGLANALLHDKNAGVRIAAVNAIAAASIGGRPIDKTVLKDLKEKALYDNNTFIRNQSRNVLEEASQL